MLFYDTETCGLTGPLVLIQYAVDDGPIELWHPWKETVGDTKDLIEWMMLQDNCGFNLAFDHFQLIKFYTMLYELDRNDIPENNIEKLAVFEEQARFLDICLKPKSACDLLLVARKTKYQSLMSRDDVRLKRIPRELVLDLQEYLETHIKFDDIYFARRKDKYAPRWEIRDLDDTSDFYDIVLKFHPKSGLKNLAVHALGVKESELLKYGDVEVDNVYKPTELLYAPFALAVGKPGNWKGAWPDKIYAHIEHWYYNTFAKKYATDDVEYTRGLYYYFGSPEPGDVDSELAIMVGSNRWRGFRVNLDRIALLRKTAVEKQGKTPQAPGPVFKWISEKLSENEITALHDDNGKPTTKKVILEELSKLMITCPDCNGNGGDCQTCRVNVSKRPFETCPICYGDDPDCERCGGDGEIESDEEIKFDESLGKIPHPAALRAEEVLTARRAKKEEELYDKLITTRGVLHASFNVIGTLSTRMSGTDKLNPQGIKRTEEVRKAFPLAYDGMVLAGGDFKAFEVTLADAEYGDPRLRKDLLSGKKMHALFGVNVYPDKTYEQILATDGTANDLYNKSKSAVFAMFYGGEAFTLKDRLGVAIEVAEEAYQKFTRRYPGVGKARRKIIQMFQSMTQPGGIGSRIIWKEPAEFIESMFGFRRYFTLENSIVKALFNLASDPPSAWMNYKIKVTRRDRSQLPVGAVRSALYACCFSIQARNMRAAANHRIQSSGAQITKDLQNQIWQLQPSGVHEWVVQTFNVHDEVMVPCKEEMIPQIREIVRGIIEKYEPDVPLIGIDWHDKLETWGDK